MHFLIVEHFLLDLRFNNLLSFLKKIAFPLKITFDLDSSEIVLSVIQFIPEKKLFILPTYVVSILGIIFFNLGTAF